MSDLRTSINAMVDVRLGRTSVAYVSVDPRCLTVDLVANGPSRVTIDHYEPDGERCRCGVLDLGKAVVHPTVCFTHRIPDALGQPIPTPVLGCTSCARWMAANG